MNHKGYGYNEGRYEACMTVVGYVVTWLLIGELYAVLSVLDLGLGLILIGLTLYSYNLLKILLHIKIVGWNKK